MQKERQLGVSPGMQDTKEILNVDSTEREGNTDSGGGRDHQCEPLTEQRYGQHSRRYQYLSHVMSFQVMYGAAIGTTANLGCTRAGV